jgi:hypothetical protein
MCFKKSVVVFEIFFIHLFRKSVLKSREQKNNQDSDHPSGDGGTGEEG